MTASQVVSEVRISDVFVWLGGDKPRRGRAKAFYRGGDGLSLSFNDDRGGWFDHAEGTGGGTLDLIARVNGGTRQDGLKWLAEMLGATLDDNPAPSRRTLVDAARIAADASYFADAANLMAEEQLAQLAENDPERAEWTRLIRSLRISPESEYRTWWRNGNAQMAAALVHAGRERAKRLQKMLAGFLAAEVFDVAAQ